MELRQLRYFIAVAENLSFSKAAQQLHVTVPPLSRQVRQLEEEFGVRLLVRDRKHVELSDAGRLFLREAKVLVTQAARMSDSVRLAKCGAAGLVRVGVGPALGERAARVLLEHAKQYPGVEVQCRDRLSCDLYKGLVNGEIDVAFLRPCFDWPELNSEVLFREPMVVHLSRANPLAKRKSLRIKDLANETLLLFEREAAPGLYDKTLKLYSAAGIHPNTVIVAADPIPHNDTQHVLLACRKGIRIAPDEIAARPAAGSEVAVVPLDEPEAFAEVHVTWRRDEEAPAVMALVDCVRRVLQCAIRVPVAANARAVGA